MGHRGLKWKMPGLFVLRSAQHGKPSPFLVGAADERFPQQPSPVVNVAGSAIGKISIRRIFRLMPGLARLSRRLARIND